MKRASVAGGSLAAMLLICGYSCTRIQAPAPKDPPAQEEAEPLVGTREGAARGRGGDDRVDPAEHEQTLIDLTNDVRRKNGRADVARNELLMRAAREQAKRCADAGYLSHELGGDLGMRVNGVGYRFVWAAENLAFGSSTPQGTINQWLNSQGHFVHMIAPEAQEIGVGVAQGARAQFWCQVFGAPAKRQQPAERDVVNSSGVSVTTPEFKGQKGQRSGQ